MNPSEHYILNQNEPYKSILLHLKAIIKAVAPSATLLYKWRIPFYYTKDVPICFFNQTKNYVDLGFWHHHKLEKYHSFFINTHRKYVRSLRYYSLEDMKDKIVVYVIEQQLAININPFKRV